MRFLVSARGPDPGPHDLAGACQSRWRCRGPATACSTSAPRRSGRGSRPPVIPSRLPTGAAAQEPIATLFCRTCTTGLEPHVQRGEVKTIRVVREMQKTVRIDPSLRAFGFQFPVISCGATYAGKDVLGEVPVEPDGSACFRVPAGMPIYFMALDAGGRAVQRMRSFTHLMPGEVQGCVGCHESPARSRPCGNWLGLRPAHRRSCSRRSGAAAGSTTRGSSSRCSTSIASECHNPIDPPKRIDLTGGKTDSSTSPTTCWPARTRADAAARTSAGFPPTTARSGTSSR